MSQITPDTIATVTAFFNHVDTDHDGVIGVPELQEALAVDYDSNGVITADEKVKAGAQWLNNGFDIQDVNQDNKLTLAELLGAQ